MYQEIRDITHIICDGVGGTTDPTDGADHCYNPKNFRKSLPGLISMNLSAPLETMIFARLHNKLMISNLYVGYDKQLA